MTQPIRGTGAPEEPRRALVGPAQEVAEALATVSLERPTAVQRAYLNQAAADVAGLRELPHAGGLPRTVDVQVPFDGYNLQVQVHCEEVGRWKNVPGSAQPWPLYSLQFSTHVLSLHDAVFSSLTLSLDPTLADPVAAVRQVVSSHVQAIARVGSDRLSTLPSNYTVRAGQDGAPVVEGDWPGGQYEGARVTTYTRQRERRQPSEDDIELRLSSGKTVRTTRERLEKARRLADKITFVVRADGSQVKAGADLVEKVAQRLAAFSVQDMARLEEAGYKVMLVDRERKPKGGYPGGRPGLEVNDDGTWTPGVLGYASYEDKVIAVPLDAIDKVGGGGSDVLLHEFAHALSDARVADEPRWRILGFGIGTQVQSMDTGAVTNAHWNAYRRRCGWVGKDQPPQNPAAVWSWYALTGPQEYLAEGISFYKQGGRERALLKDKDPGFYNSLRTLFPDD